MTIARWFEWWQLIALAVLNLLGIVRGVVLYSRGIRVVAIDRRRTISQVLRDLILLVCLLLWFYESVADAFSFRILPTGLYAMIVDAVSAQAVGAILMLGGLVVYALAIRAFGVSWRLGIDHERPGPLVTGGAFAWTRNPIYVALDLCVVGTFLIRGRLVFLVLAVGVVCLLHDQIRREESFLAEAYGHAYRDYCARIGRYVTWPFGRGGS
jgi:protein-S-isoprenylcysteine O-methyltransferase Ste14